MISLHQETQTDLEVILEFLEEYYKQSGGENGKRKAWIVILVHFFLFLLAYTFCLVSGKGALDRRGGATTAGLDVLRAACEY